MLDNKKFITILIAILVALITVLFFYKPSNNKEIENLPEIEQVQQTNTEIEQPAEDNQSENTSEEVAQDTVKENIKAIEAPKKNVSEKISSKPKEEIKLNKITLPKQQEEQKTLTTGIEEEAVIKDVYKDETGAIIVNKLFAFKSKAKYLFK